MNKLLVAPLLAVLVAAPAWAGTGTRVTNENAAAPQSDAFRDLVEVQTTRSPVAANDTARLAHVAVFPSLGNVHG